MTHRSQPMRSIIHLSGTIVVMAVLGACSSGNKKGLPKNLPPIALNTTSATPPHSMPSYSYPFDSSGNYVTTWAAEGERRSGRSAAASSSSRRSSVSKYTSSRPKVSTARKSSSSSSRSHVVRSGDTLYGIARRYGTTVAKIKAANGLRSDIIRTGARLKIPR